MKQPILIFLSLLAACRQPTPPYGKAAANDSAVYYPYSPVYTNDYEMASPWLSQQVLNFWKEFETGDVMHAGRNCSDTLSFILPDVVLQGSRDSVLHAFKKRRAAYSDMQCYIDSWMPMRAKGRNEQLVFLWGRQDGTTIKGTRVYRVLHEIWRFDRAGKIRQLEQYETHAH